MVIFLKFDCPSSYGISFQYPNTYFSFVYLSLFFRFYSFSLSIMLSKFLSLINHDIGLASNSCFGWGDMYFFLYSSSKKGSLFSNNFVFDMRCLIFFSSCSRYFCRFSLSSYLLVFCLVCSSRYRCPLHVAGIGLAGMKGFISESYFCYFSSIIYLTLRYRMVMCSRGLVRLNYLTTTGLNTGFSYFSYLLSLIFFMILSI